ncbi:PREDICTED: uncharacterized protein LOC109231741 [Nicotiana attenuata]|uniref:uncharacterized protein LOC109231741 n=1 Tax=Nicotiana attenuata TaxID=49451 RepID=UPI0009054E53|nr:PREDICTED: uncharacterized protein LOC109231741 [Nicotiana attenuata]
MISTLTWNVRGIRTAGVIELRILRKLHNISLIAVQEPFLDDTYLNNFKIQLSMHYATSNTNNKIWVFWNQDFTGSVINSDEQQVTLDLKHVEASETFHISVIYAKCKPILRRPLWDSLRLKAPATGVPWCAIGDFNVIASIEEKIGGHPYQINKSIDFLSMMEDCGFTDLGFYGPRYTWSNGRGPCAIVWKRLDRGMVNDNWLTSFPATIISHLASTASDHSPLLMEMHVRLEGAKKYFKFLNCCTENASFLPLVQTVWDKQIQGNAMWIFHQKTKALCSELSKWSRREYGDIFQQVKEYESKVIAAEEVWAHTNNPVDREVLHNLRAQYVKHLKTEESVLKQKTQLQLFKEGDANSKYFHSLVRGRRRKLFIHQIKNEEGEWIQGDEPISKAACEHFQNMFTDPGGTIREDQLSCIPSLVTHEDNENINKEPTMEEVKNVFFSMNPTSAAGPDRLNGKFYQHCWEIIKQDLVNVVLFLLWSLYA